MDGEVRGPTGEPTAIIFLTIIIFKLSILILILTDKCSSHSSSRKISFAGDGQQ